MFSTWQEYLVGAGLIGTGVAATLGFQYAQDILFYRKVEAISMNTALAKPVRIEQLTVLYAEHFGVSPSAAKAQIAHDQGLDGSQTADLLAALDKLVNSLQRRLDAAPMAASASAA